MEISWNGLWTFGKCNTRFLAAHENVDLPDSLIYYPLIFLLFVEASRFNPIYFCIQGARSKGAKIKRIGLTKFVVLEVKISLLNKT